MDTMIFQQRFIFERVVSSFLIPVHILMVFGTR
jgi:hypothetical protein